MSKKLDEIIQKTLANIEEDRLVTRDLLEDAMEYHPKAFLYLDPPYMLKGSQNSLYGVDGNLHNSFDHERLHSLLTKRNGWVMSYNDCDKIREMYKDYEIIEASWSSGMNKSKQSSEILIKG